MILCLFLRHTFLGINTFLGIKIAFGLHSASGRSPRPKHEGALHAAKKQQQKLLCQAKDMPYCSGGDSSFVLFCLKRFFFTQTQVQEEKYSLCAPVVPRVTLVLRRRVGRTKESLCSSGFAHRIAWTDHPATRQGAAIPPNCKAGRGKRKKKNALEKSFIPVNQAPAQPTDLEKLEHCLNVCMWTYRCSKTKWHYTKRRN